MGDVKGFEAVPVFDHRPQLPARPGEHPVGIVGAGAIAAAGHLPAYQKAGFQVVAIADVDQVKAERLAGRFGIPVVYTDPVRLINDPAVEIVDLAVTPWVQVALAGAAIEAGKHVLCQKPFALDRDAARALVEQAERAGVRLAVNQQLRWDPVVRSAGLLKRSGWYGDLTRVLFDIDVTTDWSSWPWMGRVPHLELWFHTIHYLDAARYLFGEPEAVSAVTASGDRGGTSVLEYPDGFQVVVATYHDNWSEPRAVVHCCGTEGRSEGVLGSLYDYPQGRPDSLRLARRGDAPQTVLCRRFAERWIPDAFVGPMAELQLAIEACREPSVSGRDNLGTLALVQAAARSADTGRRVALERSEEDR